MANNSRNKKDKKTKEGFSSMIDDVLKNPLMLGGLIFLLVIIIIFIIMRITSHNNTSTFSDTSMVPVLTNTPDIANIN